MTPNYPCMPPPLCISIPMYLMLTLCIPPIDPICKLYPLCISSLTLSFSLTLSHTLSLIYFSLSLSLSLSNSLSHLFFSLLGHEINCVPLPLDPFHTLYPLCISSLSLTHSFLSYFFLSHTLSHTHTLSRSLLGDEIIVS